MHDSIWVALWKQQDTKHKIKQCALWSKVTEVIYKLHANYVEMHPFAEQSVDREQKDV